MQIIKVDKLKKTYKTTKRNPGLWNATKALFKKETEIKEALKEISFEIEKGEIVGFIGPNGAGKSTTIKALSGVLHPTSGTINVLGFVPWEERTDYVANIGVVFGQKPQLWWDLPAMDSFYLNKDIYEIPEKEFQENLDKMITLLDLKEVVTKPVRDLSLGERMKCKLVASLLHNPKLVFLDEPSIGLDVIAKNVMRDFIIETNKKSGTTFLVTTHDMQEIEKLCDRVIIINEGEIIFDGPLEQVKKEFQNYKVIDAKFSTSKNNFSHDGCKILEKSTYEIKVEINTEKTTLKEVIKYLLKEYDIIDINVNDPPIEEIIETIFRKNKK